VAYAILINLVKTETRPISLKSMRIRPLSFAIQRYCSLVE